MSTATSSSVTPTAVTPAVATTEAKVRLSWKMPISLLVGTLLLLLMALNAHGSTTLRTNSSDQSFNIPDAVVNASVVLWAFTVIAAILTALSFVLTARRRDGGAKRTASAILVGFMVVFGFLVYAGAGSTGAVTLTSVLVSTVAISTPLIFGALSGVISEHGGVVNIAIEGDLLAGAFAGALVASLTRSPWIGLLAAPLMGALIGSLLALFSVKYGVDQIIVGVVLNVLVLGLTTFFSRSVMKTDPETYNTNKYSLPNLPIPGLSKIPILGPMLFNQTLLVYLMYAAVILLSIYLYRSRWGLRLRAVGEHPKAADTVGIDVNRTRTRNTIGAGALAGLGGAFFTIGSGLAFSGNISAGNGYIALAAMILGKWNPLGSTAAAVMFGFAQAVARLLPALNGQIPSQLVNMIPYVITIIAVAGFVGRSNPPASENIPYVK